MSIKIKGKIKIVKIRYIKNDWGIAVVAPIEFEGAKPDLDEFGTFIIKGTMIDPKEGEEYQIIAEEVEDPKWGLQYDIVSFTTNAHVDESSENSKRKYLEHIFTEGQVNALYEALADPFTALKTGNAELLTKVRGCGLRNAARWINKFNANYYLSRLYVELEEFGLTPNMMKRLLDYYKSPELVVKRVKENPYLLTEVGGVGFKTADNIAMTMGMPQWDERRIGAYILYSLDKHGREGNSFVLANELMDELVEQFGEDIPDLAIASTIHGDIKDRLWWSEDKTEIGLKRYYKLEENICNEIRRISEAPVSLYCEDIDARIAAIEQRQGWKFTDQQRLGIKTANESNVTIINGAAGCVDCDTEFFTGEGWKRIADYQEGDKVLQYNGDGTAELVEPLAYIKQPCDTLYHFETARGLSQTLSDEHRVLYYTRSSKGYIKHIEPFKKVRQKTEAHCFNGKFNTVFKYSGQGIQMTDNEIKLAIAVFADGRFEKYALNIKSSYYGTVRINLKKDRKKERLEFLLNSLRIDYKKTNIPTQDGYQTYYFKAPIISKHFPIEWYNCTFEQLQIITEEVMYWDGDFVNKKAYMTNDINDAIFIQFAFSATGRRASISIGDRVGQDYLTAGKHYKRKSLEYRVLVAHNNFVGWGRRDSEVPEIQPIIPKDGFKYCFSVPSSFLVLRKDGRIFVTGNSGKSSIAGAINEIFNNVDSAACCLSGKAAARLGEIIGTPGSTIHRLLGFNPEIKGFTHDKENPLSQQLIIIDEISMIGGSLFYNLLQAIASGTKVVMLGDTGQLEAIGECNVANDLINSGAIPVVTLDKIHRQATKSAIITESMKVRNGTQIIPKDYAGIEILGEKQDMVIDCYSDKANTAYKTLEYFKSELAEYDGDVLKVQMIVPMRSRGEVSVWNLNKLAQDYCNPDEGQDSVKVKYANRGLGELRVGDKVIATQNNYRDCYMAESADGEIQSVPIFNGYIGIIDEIDPESYMVIDFLNLGRVIVPSTMFSTIELAYAITVHKFQGAQTESVIIALDYSAYSLLSKELVYTAITRAQKKCTLVAQNSALRFAVDTTRTSTKKTHLERLLKGEYESKELIF